MIYLIDDNTSNQQEKYGCSFIKEGIYSSILTYLRGIPTHERQDFLDLKIKKANAVFFHSTSKDMDSMGKLLETTETILKLSQFVKDNNIPYISFSWGHTSNIALFKEDSIEIMNKQIFYSHLQDFLDFYDQNGILDFKIISDGLGYFKDNIITLGLRIVQLLEEKANDEMADFKNDNLWEPLKDFLKRSESKIDNSTFHDNYHQKITNKDLIDIINKSITSIRKYGKNIYY